MSDLLTVEKALRDLKKATQADEAYAKSIAEQINRGTGGRELSLAITNLQQARQWTDEALVEIAKGKRNE